MDGRKFPELPNEIVNYIGTFFGSKREDLRARNNARLVCKQWHGQIPPRFHLYILGSPVLVQQSLYPKQQQWETISAETVKNSFTSIPQDGFLVFPTYTDAHLYAHQFHTGSEEPNINNGIQGTGCRDTVFLYSRNQLLYHPVVFEVAYQCKALVNIEWHPFTIFNQDGQKKVRVSAIREPNCKAKLEVLSSKLAIEFVSGRQIELKTLYDSVTLHTLTDPTGFIQFQSEVLQDARVDFPPEKSSRCLMM